MMTVAKPSWTSIPASRANIWQGLGTQKLAVVCHIMQGSLAACDAWFANPAAQASANFGVGKDGQVHCYVDPEGPDAPFANGEIAQPDAAAQALMAQDSANLNYWTVSIEHEGNSGDDAPPLQIAASAWLAAWCCDQFSIPADRAHLLGHYQFDAVNRAGCPGWDETTWAAWLAAVQEHLATVPTPTPDLAARVATLESTVSRLNSVLTKRFQLVREALDPANPPA